MITLVNADLDQYTLQARREFNAPVSLVWRTYTEKELLDQWWAPRPWKTETIALDFRVNGKWAYDMVGPNGERHSAMQIFREIVFEKYFSGIDAFVDEEGNIDDTMPVATWKNTFEPTVNGTLVIIDSVYPDRESLEFALRMGVDKGVSRAHDHLAEVLQSLMRTKT